MANEFKIKHGFVSTGNGTVEGEIRVSGIAYAENGSRLATRAYLSQFLTDNNYVVTGDLPTNISAFTNDSGYLTEIIAHTHSAADITSGTLSNDRLNWNVNDDFSGTYSLLWNASNSLYTASWLQVRGSDDTLLTRNIVADGTVTGTNLMVSNWNAAHAWGDHDGLYDTAGTGAAEAGTVNTRIDSEIIPLIDTKQDAGDYLTELPSHNHNDLYYTETEVNTFLSGKLSTSGGTLNGDLTINQNGSALNLRSTTNSQPSRITFSSDVPADQIGYIEYSHVNTASYGSGESFVIGGNQADITILADGKLMYKEGIYSKPSSGTGAGTRKDVNWDTAYGWGNHASVGYLTTVPSEYLTQTEGDARYDGLGAANTVNDRIDNEVLPSIPTNNNELTNGAGYITDGNTGWNNTYGFITASDSITGNAATATKLATARNIALSGAVTGNANFDGSGNITIATTATSDPTLTLAGDASGSATFTNLGNATLTVTVANDSHTHDGRYYTESESDARFVNVTGDNLTGDLSVSGASLSVTSTADGSEAFFVDGVNGRLFTITDSLSDSLFSVNTISGLPVIEAFSDNTVKLGPFSNPVTIDAAGVLAIGGVTAATQTYVDTAVNNIIGGAPGALDTLNELAAAINDDASFASSVTTSLSLKAPLASPALTGTPTAPTQATSNNSTRIATTAFVKAQGYVTTDTNYYLNGITRSGNVLTFSVNGATNQTYTFGSAAWAATTAFDAAGTAASEAGAVNLRIDEEVLPAVGAITLSSLGYTGATNANYITNNNELTNGAGYITSADGGNAQTLDGIDSTSFLRSDANDSFSGTLTMSTQKALVASNYGNGVYGVYDASRYQHVWSMGVGYNLPENGASNGNGGSLYGLAWSYNPDYGYSGANAQSKPGLNHQLLLMMNGVTHTALGSGIWTNGLITTVNHGTSANWNTAYGWGNHASAGYLTALPSHNHDDRYYTETEADSRFHRTDGPLVLDARGPDIGGSASYVTSGSGDASLEAILNNVVLNLNTNGDEPATIYFKSGVNEPSDFAYISFLPNKAGTSEEAVLQLGVENDGAGSSDYIRLQGRVSTVVDYVTSEATVIQDWVYQGTQKAYIDVSGNLQLDGTITANGYNKSNWDTAFGWGNHASAGYAQGSFLPLAGGTVTGTIAANGGINMNNTNITNVNHITINDPGYAEGIQWGNMMISESPDDLSNQAGNLHIANAGDSSIRVTIDPEGNLYPSRDRLHLLGKDTNRWQIVFCEILDSAGQHEKNLQNPEGEKSVGDYATGTVLVWKGGKNIPCTEYADHMRMGIAVKDVASPLIQGAEPVLVTGKVTEGDYLITSRKEGHAEAISPELMRQQGLYDCVLGKALENGQGESHLVKTWINI